MLLRIATAAVLIPIVVALVWFGPPALLAAIACVVAILALFEFFDIGDKVGLRGFKKWTYFGTALIFYSQYSVGLGETHSFAGGVSVVRNAAGGVLSLDAAFLIFIFGCVALGLPRAARCSKFCPPWPSAPREFCSSLCRSATSCASTKSNASAANQSCSRWF